MWRRNCSHFICKQSNGTEFGGLQVVRLYKQARISTPAKKNPQKVLPEKVANGRKDRPKHAKK